MSFNRWGYGLDNPSRYTDPSGMCVNPDGSVIWWKWPWFDWGPCPADTTSKPTVTITPALVIIASTTCTNTPTSTSTQSPTLAPTSTLYLEPWKTDRGYEAETGSLGYDTASNSIRGWGTDNSGRARKIKAEKVYEWISLSGGYWGTVSSGEKTLAAWLLFKEGGVLYVADQYNMSRGIHYRFGRWGFNSTQLSAFTAFLNPKRDDFFNEEDWKWLTNPGAAGVNMSRYQQITDEVYAFPYTELDSRYLYWFGGDEMQKVGVTEAQLRPLGLYTSTNSVNGSPFYFTGIPNVFKCVVMGGNAYHPPSE